jgi:hypothetical protein
MLQAEFVLTMTLQIFITTDSKSDIFVLCFQNNNLSHCPDSVLFLFFIFIEYDAMDYLHMVGFYQ